MTFDREGLKRWYREAMRGRLKELRDLRSGLMVGDPSALDRARAVAQALRGSGATYGYPELSEAAAMIESAHDTSVFRRVEGLVEGVRRLAYEDEPGGSGLGAEWLEIAATGQGVDWTPESFESLEAAWAAVASRHDLAPEELAKRVAAMFGLETADVLEPSRAALRLVPESLLRGERVLPLREDAERVTLATADPTSLDVEAELVRLTGRTPVFVVALPERLRDGIEALYQRGPRPAVGASGPSQRTVPSRRPADAVLVVDDDAPARVLARRLLEKGGYTVCEAEDGEAALDVLDGGQGVALIVADLNMPRLDGLELIWEVRERPEWTGIPVIVVTGESDEILEAKLIEEGADDYIRKPLDPRLFLARVAATIRRAEH